jgi:sugar transferase EpsL
MSFYRTTGKRIIDVSLSAVGLAAAAPLIIVLALVILNARPFMLYKFRSMNDARSPDGELLGDEGRLTALGKWLRKLSLDELPQLWNVLKGDMSLVGPRPLLMGYLPLYDERQRRRHEVRPGITGWAQVKGRNALSWEEKFDLDVWYVERQSFALDLRIIGMTIAKLVRPHGISQPGSATMPRFTGSARDD